MNSRTLLFVITLLVIAWNYLVNALPLNGNEIGVLSFKYETYLNPAPYAFSIWGLIYLGLVSYAIVQRFFPPKQNEWIDELNSPVTISFIANAVWLAFFHYELLLLSVLAMLVLLFSLGKAFVSIRPFKKHTPKWVQGTLGLYLGWVCVAFSVNLSLYLKHIGLGASLDSQRVFYFIVLSILFIFSVLFLVRYKSILFGLAISWAFIAISFDQMGESLAITYAPIFAGVALIFASMFVIGLKPR